MYITGIFFFWETKEADLRVRMNLYQAKNKQDLNIELVCVITN